MNICNSVLAECNKFHIAVIVIISIIVGYLLFKNYWRIQKKYNNTLLSYKTPLSEFPIDEHTSNGINLKDVYNEITKIGEHEASRSSIVICSLVKDIEDVFDTIKDKVYSVTNLFKSYKILLVENDSKDKTRELILGWVREDPNVVLLGCGYNKEGTCHISEYDDGNPIVRKVCIGSNHVISHKRINKMANLRNIYLDEVKRMNSVSSIDYMLVWDLDLVSSLYTDGVMNSLGWLAGTSFGDVITAHGIYKVGPVNLYYDAFAHVEPTFYNDAILRLVKGSHKLGDLPYQVTSAFGGAALYKVNSLRDSRYKTSDYDDPNVMCEHTGLHENLKVYSNPSMIHLLLHNA